MTIASIILLCLLNQQTHSLIQQYNNQADKDNEIQYSELDEHTLVTEPGVFPYMAAILKKSTYVSAGALIDENWVLTAADSLFLIRESSRMIRVRLGSTNYKKGGLLLPIKYFEIHPYFDDKKPLFDLALMRLAESVRFNSNMKAINWQKVATQTDATHFTVTSWSLPTFYSEEEGQLTSMEIIKKRRILSVTHLHPIDQEDCLEELQGIGINSSDSVICLDTGVMMDPCMRDVGAPVVLNGILVSIVSSWRPAGCESDLAGPSFGAQVAHKNISSWIHSTVHGHRWITKMNDHK